MFHFFYLEEITGKPKISETKRRKFRIGKTGERPQNNVDSKQKVKESEYGKQYTITV